MTRISRWLILVLFAALIIGANMPIAAAPATMKVADMPEGFVIWNRIDDAQALADYQASLSGGCVADYVIVKGARACVVCNHINNSHELAAYQASLSGGCPPARIVMVRSSAF